MPNQPIASHRYIGQTHRYRPWLPPYDPDLDTSPGMLVLGHGMTVEIKAVFRDWNDVTGLDMLYVFCPATSQHTHVTPADLCLPPVDCDGLPLSETRCPDRAGHM